jgi:hypothetical protein
MSTHTFAVVGEAAGPRPSSAFGDRTASFGAAARAFVAANWCWETLFLKLEGAFDDAIDGLPTAPAESAIVRGRSARTGAASPGGMSAAR